MGGLRLGAREVGLGGRGLRSLWRLGLGVEASLACLRAGFDDLGLARICAETATANLPAQKLLQRSGFRETGKNPDGWPVYALSREDFQQSRPDQPI